MLIQIDSGYFCAGVELINNQVTLFAPILYYMRGWNIQRIESYCHTKKWKLSKLNNMQIEVRLVLLEEMSEDIQISTYSRSAKGIPASPEKLFRITKTALEAGICFFTYLKKDGTLRKATGTRKYDIMPKQEVDPAAKPFRPQDHADNDVKTAYWDYESNSFKSFQNNSVVAVLVL